ncbi:MAG: hypothetical protein M3371_04130, partial [Acidobacteriota bacterium]|nr:hypothetical protein [Acidobacteriota bacterium]
FLLTATKNWRVAVWALLALVVTAAIFILPRRAGMPYPFVSQALWAAGVAGLIVAWWRNAGERFGANLAVLALALIVVYWGGLALLHARALSYARLGVEAAAERGGELLLNVAAMPALADPLNWRAVAETDRAFYRFNSSAITSSKTVDGWLNAERFTKPQGVNAALAARAAEDWRAQIFLDFARFPATRAQTDCVGQTLVQFADLRFTQPGPARNGGGSFHLEVVVP